MNREDIIKMAREAGAGDITVNGWTTWVGTQTTEFLERFANLVAAAEREACAKVCDKRAELSGIFTDEEIEAYSCAKEIRARGEK